MPRIKLTIPKEFYFTCQIPVRITDVNYGGHVGNDSLLAIIHEARMQFLQHYGYSEMDLAGVGLIMSDAAIEFKNEAFFKDTIIVSVTASDFQRVGFDICYKLEKETAGKKTTIAVAKTGMVCFNYHERKIAAIPAAVIQKLGAA